MTVITVLSKCSIVRDVLLFQEEVVRDYSKSVKRCSALNVKKVTIYRNKII
jgi:hypothetical protein